MNRLTRRQILKHLAAIPMAAPILGIVSCRNNVSTPKNVGPAVHPCDPKLASPANPGINVFLHGLFLLSTQAPTAGMISLYAPEVPGPNGHVYMAGRWLRESTLYQGFDIALNGIDPMQGQQPTFDSKQHFMMPQTSGNPTFKSATSHFGSFQLPYPAAKPKFRRAVGKPGSDFFVSDSSHSDYGMRPNSIPLEYVFTYPESQFKPGQPVKLTMTKNGTQIDIWSYSPDPSDLLSYDLHIFAAPPPPVDQTHLDDAIVALSNMFQPNLTLKLVNSSLMDPQLGCAEDASLEERYAPNPNHGGGGTGGEIVNCMTFILGG